MDMTSVIFLTSIVAVVLICLFVYIRMNVINILVSSHLTSSDILTFNLCWSDVGMGRNNKIFQMCPHRAGGRQLVTLPGNNNKMVLHMQTSE